MSTLTTSSIETLPSARIIFDENFGAPHIERLKQYIAGQPRLDATVLHALSFQQQGVWDENWIPQKAQEGWIIISHDRGKQGWKKGEPLPRVCIRHRVTHVLLSGSAAKRTMTDKIQIVLSVWPQILTLHSEPRGSRFLLALRAEEGSTQARLINKTSQEIKDAHAAEAAITHPYRLFDPENPPV